jgi:hypothetical protein
VDYTEEKFTTLYQVIYYKATCTDQQVQSREFSILLITSRNSKNFNKVHFHPPSFSIHRSLSPHICRMLQTSVYFTIPFFSS